MSTTISPDILEAVMRFAPMFLFSATFLVLTLAMPAGPLAQEPQYNTVEVQVAAGPDPLPNASVALDLNNNGVWDEHLGEPRGWTNTDGIVFFGNITSVGDYPYGHDWRPTQILFGNHRGTVGARGVLIDFLLPEGATSANLGLFDLRGRRIAQIHGPGDLELDLSPGLPSGVYVLRLSAGSVEPATQRITSVGSRTRSIKAHRVSVDEAVAAGWAGPRALDQDKGSRDPQQINLIVEHDNYPTVVQAETLMPGANSFTVDMLAGLPAGFVFIPPGTFTMGSPTTEPGRWDNETQHPVTLTQGFYMSRYEVTEAWWYQVMGGTPTTSQLPKNSVSWDLAVQFCNTLSLQQGLTPAYTIHGTNGNVTWNQGANGYRLPTEAEWEYACRAGSTTAFANGPITHIYCSPLDPNLNAMGWYCGNRTWEEGPAVVGQKQANSWGLYDMHGNLWEWVWDGYRADYQNLPSVNPVHNVGPGASRVVRGGHWSGYAQFCRSAIRGHYYPDDAVSSVGFRPVRSAP